MFDRSKLYKLVIHKCTALRPHHMEIERLSGRRALAEKIVPLRY